MSLRHRVVDILTAAGLMGFVVLTLPIGLRLMAFRR
jgi:hypothetical protein